MSDSAKSLLFWIGEANSSVADNEDDRAYCLRCARNWAAAILAGTDPE